jgi:hypothetical protein
MSDLFKTKSLWILLIICLSLVFVRAAYIPFNDPSGGRSYNRGDGYSDNNTLSAIRYFSDHGLWHSKLRPIHNYENRDEIDNSRPYLRYPALPDVVHASVGIGFGAGSEFKLRLFPIFLSIVWFFVMFSFLKRELGDQKAALLSLAVLVTSNYYLAWADNLHKHLYEELGKWSYVMMLLSYHRSASRKPALLAALFVLAILVANASFEPIVFLAVATVGFSVIFEKGWKKIFSVSNVVLGLGFVVGFVLHFYLNSLYLNSWALALQDMQAAFSQRTGAVDLLKLPLTAVQRVERYFLVPGFALIILSYFPLRKWWQEDREKFWIAIVLLLSSFSWYVVMKQHAAVHHFVAKQAGLYVGFVIGPALLMYWELVKRDWSERRGLRQALHAIFLLYMAGMALTQQVLDIWWEHGFKRLFF